jgi:hypothetical protein
MLDRLLSIFPVEVFSLEKTFSFGDDSRCVNVMTMKIYMDTSHPKRPALSYIHGSISIVLKSFIRKTDSSTLPYTRYAADNECKTPKPSSINTS